MNEVAQILNAIEQGDPQAAEQLLPLVYDQLRKLAAQKLLEQIGEGGFGVVFMAVQSEPVKHKVALKIL